MSCSVRRSPGMHFVLSDTPRGFRTASDKFAHMAGTRIEAVIFDWGGTLTRWHDVDFHAESVALAQAVQAYALAGRRPPRARRPPPSRRRHRVGSGLRPPAELHHRRPLRRGRARPRPRPAAGLLRFWEPHTSPIPRCGPCGRCSRSMGVKVGVLSNTIWPRAWQSASSSATASTTSSTVSVLERDPVDQALPVRLRGRDRGRGSQRPGRVRLRGEPALRRRLGRPQRRPGAIHIPLSTIPAEQLGHTEGEPDASVTSLARIPSVVRSWDDGASAG